MYSAKFCKLKSDFNKKKKKKKQSELISGVFCLLDTELKIVQIVLHFLFKKKKEPNIKLKMK